MQVTIRQLAEALYYAAQEKKGAELSTVLDNTLAFMRDQGILSKKDQLFEALEQIRLQDEGKILVKIFSRRALSQSHITEIKDYVRRQTKLEPEIEEILDPAYEGGVKIIFGDTEIDGSINKQLQALRQHLKV